MLSAVEVVANLNDFERDVLLRKVFDAADTKGFEHVGLVQHGALDCEFERGNGTGDDLDGNARDVAVELTAASACRASCGAPST